MSDVQVTVTNPSPVAVTVTDPTTIAVMSAGTPGPPGIPGADGEDGRGVHVYEQDTEPLEAMPGDIWFVT